MSNSLITFSDVSLGYGRRTILRNLTFAIDRGDFFGLVGPNGAGKTTILRAILGTLKAREGIITLGEVNQRSVCFGYVPQRDMIDFVLPYTVEEVVMMGRYRQIGLVRRPREEDRRIVRDMLRQVDVESLFNQSFNDLSGGQKQRTLIARALASKPDVLVLDEPTNGMDLASRTSILELVRRLHARENLTVIMVTHLLDDLVDYVDRIAIVDRDFFRVGATREVLTGENLSALYRRPVQVLELRGNFIIRMGGDDGMD